MASNGRTVSEKNQENSQLRKPTFELKFKPETPRRQVKSVTVQFTGAKAVDAGVKLITTVHFTYLETCRARKWKKMKGKGGAGQEANACFMARDASGKYQSQHFRYLYKVLSLIKSRNDFYLMILIIATL